MARVYSFVPSNPYGHCDHDARAPTVEFPPRAFAEALSATFGPWTWWLQGGRPNAEPIA